MELRNSELARRTFVRGAAAFASLAALGGAAACTSDNSRGTSTAITKGPGPGGYKIDLGGYQGPELTTEQITLKFLRQSYSDAMNARFVELYAQFNKAYPNIKIAEELIPYGNLPQKIQIYTQSGDAPDIMMSRLDFTTYMARSGTALDLTGYFSDKYLSDLFKPIRDAASLDGKMFLMPWEGYVPVILYNRDIFKKAGVATPPQITDIDHGWTADQMIETMIELTHNLRKKGDTATWALESSILGNGGPGSNYTQCESIWIRSMGSRNAARGSSLHNTWQGVSDDGLSVTGYINTPEAIAGMRNYQRLFTEGLTPKSAIPAQFQGQQAAMSMNSTRQILQRDQPGGKAPFDVGMTLDPTGNMLFGCNSGDAPFVWAKTKHPNEAAALLGFLCSDANQPTYFRTRGAFITRRSLADNMEEYHTPDGQLSMKIADNCDGAPRTVGWSEYYSAMNPAVKNIALGADPEKTLNETAKAIDDQLKKFKS
ncbi:extracellular solute-binding protein [Sinomonas sp. ASV322]|uniref:extracellular solute-binding protein n=1 Tax=Sinomonas sp. ASV322 TaxID=3041920 RepID=UPI0027DBC871|nr:extracellular solute-binding protein [Sinomonas sp. ASV322]MDQ4504290.1 extracellular solute-binding protein [Sinomonas sp. ASV322]